MKARRPGMLVQRIGILLLLMGAWIPIRFSFRAGARGPVAVVDWSASVREDPAKRRWVLRQVERLQRRAPRLPVFAFSDTLVPWDRRDLLEARPATRWPLAELDPRRPVIWISDGVLPPPRRLPQRPVLRAVIPDSLRATSLLAWVERPRPGFPRVRVHLRRPVDSLRVSLDRELLARWVAPLPGTLDVMLPALDPGPHRLTVAAPAETLTARWREPAQAWVAGVFFRVPRDGVGVLRRLLQEAGWTVRAVWVRAADTVELTPHGVRRLHALPQVDVAWVWARDLPVSAPLRIQMASGAEDRGSVSLRDSLQGTPLLGAYGADNALWLWLWHPLAVRARAHPDEARRVFRQVTAYLQARTPRIRWMPLDTARSDPGPVAYLLTVRPALPVQVLGPPELTCTGMGEGVYRCTLPLQKDSLAVPVHLRIGSLRRTFRFLAHRERERGTPRWDVATLRLWVEATGGRIVPASRLEEALAPVPARRTVSLDDPWVGLVGLLAWLVGVWVREQRA